MARASTAQPTGAAALVYQVQALDCHAHLFAITLTIAKPAADQTVSLPVWIPGSYLVREFAKHLQRLQATQNGRTVALTQPDKCSWQVHCNPGKPLTLRYEIYAFDNSVRSAWLDTQRGFFNGTSVCLRVHGQEDTPHQLTLAAPGWPAGWQVATALAPLKVNKSGFGHYLAANYDELVDSPVELGAFWSGSFTAGGVPHRLWWPVRAPALTARACWLTRKPFAKPKSISGTPKLQAQKPSRPKPKRRITATFFCSTPWTTAMAGWSTATARR